MFIHRKNVLQYAQGRPHATSAQPSSTTSNSRSVLREQYIIAPSPAPPPAVVVTAVADAAERRKNLPRYAMPEFNSDSDEIAVEEIFPAVGPYAARSTRDTSYTYHEPLLSRSAITNEAGIRYNSAGTLLAQSTAATRQEVRVRGGTADCAASSSYSSLYLPQRCGIAGVGGVSPLTHVSPGESRLSDVYGEAREATEPLTTSDNEKPRVEVAADPSGRPIAGEPSAEEEGNERRNLLSTSPAVTAEKVPLDRQQQQPQQMCPAFNENCCTEVPTAFENPSAVSGTGGSHAPSVRSSQSPDTANQRTSHVCRVSDIGRTLTAAAKALAAAAAREAKRRDEEAAARAQVLWIPSVETVVVVDTLLSSALTEKVLLFEAYLSGLKSTSSAMELCAALYRRDAERARRETDYALKDRERATQQKVALYRQQVASEASRAEALERHRTELQAVEARVAALNTTVEELRSQLVTQAATLRAQQQAHDMAMRERDMDAHENALELRALQRAHGQATERWMTLQVLYEALRKRCEPQSRCRAVREVPRGHFKDTSTASDTCCVAPRIVPRVKPPLRCDELVTAAVPSVSHTTEHRNVSRQDRQGCVHGGCANSDSAVGEQTALEALLARTQADSAVFLASPLQSEAGAIAGPKLRSLSPTSGGGPLPYVAPPTLGGFSSPPDDTPFLTRAAAFPAASSDTDAGVVVERFNGFVESPDAKPASAGPRRMMTHQSSSPTSSSREASAGDEMQHAADSVQRRTPASSPRPSRLNSTASTQQGSSPTASNHPVDVVSSTSARGFHAAGSEFANVNVVTPAALMRENVKEEDDEEELAVWEQRLAPIAAAVVQRELARLLTFAQAGKAKRLTSLSNGSRRATSATATSGLGEHANCDACRLVHSTPRVGRGGTATPATFSGNDVEEEEEAALCVVTLSTLQWIRVCETTHLAAQVNSVLVDKLQALSSSLAQRVQLLEEKDWNKTMAKQFVAVDHAAALRRLTAKVEAVLHRPFPNTGRGSALTKNS
jgi:hypothetical protein